MEIKPLLPMTKTQIQQKIDELKPILQALNDEYAHAFARGDMESAIEYKQSAARTFNRIGKLVRQKLAAA